MGFTFDPSPVQDQISAVSNVRSKYYKALITGAVDPEEYIPLLLPGSQVVSYGGSILPFGEVQKSLSIHHIVLAFYPPVQQVHG